MQRDLTPSDPEVAKSRQRAMEEAFMWFHERTVAYDNKADSCGLSSADCAGLLKATRLFKKWVLDGAKPSSL